MSRLISRELDDEYTGKLRQLLDEEEDVSGKKRRIDKALNGELAIIAKEIKRTRRILDGAESPQEEIPGTELGERRRDQSVVAILDAAAGIALREAKPKKGEDPRRAELEADADRILTNAGAGELVKGDLRGEAVKFAKGAKGKAKGRTYRIESIDTGGKK
jgi:hypothetical protein